MGQLVQAGGNFLDLDAEEMVELTPADVGWEGYVDKDGNMKPLFTLGVFLTFDGVDDQQVQVLRKKSEDFAGQMRHAQLSPEDAKSALTLRFIKSIEYVMGVSQLTRHQWRRIMAPALLAALPKMGCARTFPRDLVYAPVSLGGLGVPNPVHRQVIKQLQLLFDEVHGDTSTGRMLVCSIQAIKAELGIGGSLFSQPFDQLHQCVTPCWVKGLWQQLQDTGIGIIETTESIALQRDGDEFLVLMWLRMGLKGAELYHLNMCRRQLGIARMSDIVTAAGSALVVGAMEGQDVPVRGQLWARRPDRLPSRWWKEWRRWCKSLCYRERMLQSPLGKWYGDDGSWQWWKAALSEEIYDSYSDPARVFVPVTRRRTRQAMYRLQGSVQGLPELVHRVSVVITERGITWDRRIGLHREPDAQPSSYDPVEDLGGDAEFGQMLEAARNHKLVVVSDGSFKDARGTSCSIMFDLRSQQHVACNTFVPGPASVHSSYRSELAGIWASLEMLAMIPELDEACTVTLALDGLQALRQAQSDSISPGQRDWDVLVEIRRLRQRIRATLKWVWVRGHQDDTGKDLTMLEKLNVECDKRAKAFWGATVSRRRARQWSSATGRWTLTVSDQHYSHVGQSELYKTLQASDSLRYWKKKFEWTKGATRQVDWDVYQGARAARKNQAMSKFVTKWSSGFVGVGRKMQQMGQQESSTCQFCGAVETTQHVLRCKEHETAWNLATKALIDRMVTIGSAPRLVSGMRVGMARWRRRQKPQSTHGDIGWYPLLLGFLHKDWRKQQSQWMEHHECVFPDAAAWTKEVVRWVWKVPWGVWVARNEKVHDGEQHPSLAELRRQVRRIAASASQDMNESEMVLLREGYQMEYGTESQMRQWIHDMQEVHSRVAARRRARTMQSERRLMSHWLGLA